jgi:hypothetical protein
LPRDLLPAKPDAATGGSNKLGQQIENRGLPRAVGTDEAVDASGANLEIDAVDGDEPFELFDQIPGLKNVLGVHWLEPAAARQWQGVYGRVWRVSRTLIALPY